MQRQQYGRCGDLKSLDRLRGHPLFMSARIRAGPFLVPSAVEGAREGAAGDKFRVSGTKEMVEGAGANKESGGCSAGL